MKFTEDTKLLFSNWQAYQDVLMAGERLAKVLSSFFEELFDSFQGCKWWSRKWHVYTTNAGTEKYIYYDDWVINGQPQVGIGLEDFTVDNIFNGNRPAILYVYVLDSKAVDLIRSLLPVFTCGTIEEQPQGQEQKLSQYVVSKSLVNCLPEDYEQAEGRIKEAVYKFVEQYVAQQPEISKAVLAYKNRTI